MLKVHSYLISYNEEQMIRHTLNHYSSFCEKIILYDNMSTDRTREIAGTFPQVEIRDFEAPLIDERKYLEIKNNAWKGSSADFVTISDMDEFLYSENLISDLSWCKEHGVSLPGVDGYNMYCDRFPGDYSKSIFDQVKNGVRATHFDKQIVFNPKMVKEINYLPGCHVSHPSGTLLRDRSHVFKLLHYKYLSTKYLLEKHEQYSRRISQYNVKHEYGREYIAGKQGVEKAFELLKMNERKVI